MVQLLLLLATSSYVATTYLLLLYTTYYNYIHIYTYIHHRSPRLSQDVKTTKLSLLQATENDLCTSAPCWDCSWRWLLMSLTCWLSGSSWWKMYKSALRPKSSNASSSVGTSTLATSRVNFRLTCQRWLGKIVTRSGLTIHSCYTPVAATSKIIGLSASR